MTDEATKVIVEQVSAMMDYAQTTQALMDLLPLVTLILEQIKRLVESDTDLGPELTAAAEHLYETSEAIQRAYKFAATRMDVKFER